MRFAVYFAPNPSSHLHRLGSEWLGRDAWTGNPVVQPEVQGLATMTESPRRYGFHATLKPPFVLDPGVVAANLYEAMTGLAGKEAKIKITLRVDRIDGFLALIPDRPVPALGRLAARCVMELDGLRKPATPAELARRRLATLTPRQEEHLQRWGYPYVLDDFYFHMTLSDRLSPDRSHDLQAAAIAHFSDALSEAIIIDGLSLFIETEPGTPFVAVQHFPFSSALTESAA